jgi:hypothetical protein
MRSAAAALRMGTFFEPTSDPRPITRRVTRALLLAAVLILLGHVVTQLSWKVKHAMPQHTLELFSMSSELSFNTWLTVVVTFSLGVACVGLGATLRERSWYLLGAFFLYLSADDATMLHERFGWMTARLDERTGVYSWVLILGPLLAIAGLLAFLRLWRTFARDRHARRQILLAFAFLGSALLIELAERRIVDLHLRVRGFPLQAYTIGVEEFLELVAPILLLSCVVGLLEDALRTRVAVDPPTLKGSPLYRRRAE